MRLGVLVSHPIQYYAPLFRLLARHVELQVFYATNASPAQQAKAGFGVEFEWDVDLLSGYNHTLLKNVSPDPGPNRFAGCDTPGIRREIEAGRFEAFVVFGWYLKAHWQAIRACRRLGVPLLVRGDSQLRGPRPILKSLGKEVTHRLALRQFDGFLAVGTRNREYLLHYGAAPSRIFSSPHFVDNEWFATQAKAARDKRGEVRRRLGIPSDAFCIAFCGKFIPRKRPLDLVRAAQLLISTHGITKDSPRRVHLLFIGSGELGPELRRNCNVVFDAENAVRPNEQQSIDIAAPTASFVGFRNQTELPSYYVCSDVLVLPSDGTETWGLVVNEGMACGLPAVVSDAVGCAPDMIDDGQTGFTFGFRDFEALARWLRQVMEQSQNGFDFVGPTRLKLTHYSVEAAAAGIVEGAGAVRAATRAHSR